MCIHYDPFAPTVLLRKNTTKVHSPIWLNPKSRRTEAHFFPPFKVCDRPVSYQRFTWDTFRKLENEETMTMMIRLGYFWKVLASILFANVAQYSPTFGRLWKTTLEVKTAKETCRATFGKINRTTFNSIIWSHWCWLSLLFMKVSSDENLSSFVPLLFAKNNHFDFKRYS